MSEIFSILELVKPESNFGVLLDDVGLDDCREVLEVLEVLEEFETEGMSPLIFPRLSIFTEPCSAFAIEKCIASFL